MAKKKAAPAAAKQSNGKAVTSKHKNSKDAAASKAATSSPSRKAPARKAKEAKVRFYVAPNLLPPCLEHKHFHICICI